tara:strand:- start:75 stop:242 length:168 start_codon:yes stop_codon:yes gene_type:complete
MKGFFNRLKSILNGDDFLDDDYLMNIKLSKVETKKKRQIIFFDPPPIYETLDQKD